jgi:hypothetical protein
VIPLGHRTYLAAKTNGDKSMSGTAGCRETINRPACQDPDGKVKARLPEAKYPCCRASDLDTMVHIQGSRISKETLPLPEHAPREPGHNQWPKGYEMATYTILNVTQARNAGLPTGQEPYGNGVPIVVRRRESRPHGEGGQVRRMRVRGGTCDA